MLNKDEISKKYFNGIKPKHLRDFSVKTPKGNTIKGFICKKPNHFLGSMLIQEVTWEEKDITFETEQFIQAMPRMHYFDKFHEMAIEEGTVMYPVSEKLDGSCLILYGLYHEDEIIEIIPKTRGLPVADSHIIEMFHELDDCNIVSFFEDFKNGNPTLIFELFGALNQHAIFYPRTRIDINLIGLTLDGDFVSWYEMDYFKRQYDFVLPSRIFNIVFYDKSWKVRIVDGTFYYYLFKGCKPEEISSIINLEYPTQVDVVQALKSMITKVNKNFSEVHNRQLLEGCVINTYKKDGELTYIKVKSADFEEKCRNENGVPRKFILKEVRKYFDEYGSVAKELYQNGENDYLEYVNENLLEEFSREAVMMRKTQDRITNIFLDILEMREPPKGLQDICHELAEANPDASVPDLMRIFSQEYPEKKRNASLVYSIFNRLV